LTGCKRFVLIKTGAEGSNEREDDEKKSQHEQGSADWVAQEDPEIAYFLIFGKLLAGELY